MKLELLEQDLACVRLAAGTAVPGWVWECKFISVTCTQDEVSIFGDEAVLGCMEGAITGWRAFRVAGQLDLELTGIVSALAVPLAAKQISAFSISTHDTDYMLMRKEHLEDAVDVLQRAGHSFVKG